LSLDKRVNFPAFAVDSVCRARQIRIVSGMRIRRSSLKFWLPPLVWMVVIFSASSDSASIAHSSRFFEPLMHWLFPQMSQIRIGEIHYLFRKCAHMAEFSILALLLWQAIRHTHITAQRGWLWSQAGLVLALVLLYAASDEIHQTFIPGRTGQLSDVMVDTAGGAIGLAMLWLAGRVFKRW